MKRLLGCLFVFCLSSGLVLAQGYSWDKTAPACQILDKAPIPVYSAELGFIGDSEFDGYGNASFSELNATLELGYFYDILQGELDLALDFDGMLLSGSADLELPDQLVACYLDAGMTWRYFNGLSLQVRIAPGEYSDLEQIDISNWNMPISVAGIRTFNSDVSAIAGFQYRYGFDREVMPILGVVWSAADWVRIEATLPKARAICYINDDWSANLSWSWDSMTYKLREKGDYDRDKITFDSYRTSIGVSYALYDSLKLTGDLGIISGREVIFKDPPVGMDGSIDISSESFIKFGIAGPF